MRILVGVILLLATYTASGEVYRWTDKSGRTHFSDTPPPASARNVQRQGSNRSSGAQADPNVAEPYVLQLARKNFPVKLYSASSCGAGCEEARKLLNSRGVPFTEVSVSSESDIAELKELVGSASVPVLLVGREIQKGFEEGAYHRALDWAGYPKAGILPRRSQSEPRRAQPDAEANDTEPEDSQADGPYSTRFRRR